MPDFILPGYGGQVSGDGPQAAYEQTAPLYNLYSPRLFGAPPQLTPLCDMRLQSSLGEKDGPVGDFYLQEILRGSQIANFIVGHAMFTGGTSSLASAIRTALQYTYALSKYQIFDNSNTVTNNLTTATTLLTSSELSQESYKRAMDMESGSSNIKTESTVGTSGVSDGSREADINQDANKTTIFDNIANLFDSTGFLGTVGTFGTILKASYGMQQAFYTFEPDWATYIQNVKMMINTAIMMLGVQDGVVRIGDKYESISLGAASEKSENDVWANYRFITAAEGVGSVNGVDTMSGDTHQYVSFMINPASISENYSNTKGQSKIYAAINAGSDIGNEIAFLTNTSKSSIDDALVELSGDVITTAEHIMTALTGGVGKFTAAVMGSVARSYTGDHTIFPDIYQSSSSTSAMTMKVQLRASAGDVYSYLTEILVPLFHIMCMALPSMSQAAASAYTYPPLVQVNIPGVWGTRLGLVSSVQIEKNPEGNDFSVNGYPLAVDVSITVDDLQHVLMTSGMNEKAMMLNNDTMFDYIAQCAGVDKYRINGSIRVVTKLALGAANSANIFYNLGNAVLNDAVSLVNRLTGVRNL